MFSEASAVSLDNGQTFLTPQNGNATIGSTKKNRNNCLAPDPSLENYFDGVAPIYARSIWFSHGIDNYF